MPNKEEERSQRMEDGRRGRGDADGQHHPQEGIRHVRTSRGKQTKSEKGRQTHENEQERNSKRASAGRQRKELHKDEWNTSLERLQGLTATRERTRTTNSANQTRRIEAQPGGRRGDK